MEGGPPDFPQGFTCPAVLWIQLNLHPFHLRGSHTLWRAFPCPSVRNASLLSLSVTPVMLPPQVWPLPRSLATTGGISVDVFSSPYLDVSVQAVPHICLFYSAYVTLAGGFPHSEISGSMLICSSPKLIAACHVLHRLLMPRHSPCALIRLTFVKTFVLTVTLIK